MAVDSRTDARRAALAELIDHAALFPPASLDMDEALAEDERVRTAPEAWLVGRFVVPLTRLEELGRDAPLRLSVVLDAEPEDRLGDPRVEAVEVPPGRAPDGLPDGREVYLERPLESLDWLDGVRDRGFRAKARCGGRAVPPVAELAAFVRRCRELSLPFKATAGLHHPVAGGREHGFLNLLAAAVFGEEEKALAETDSDAFALTAESFRWRGRSVDAAELRRVRRELFVGIGSCSVREPVDDLRQLGMLPA
jgi:hypothetical protein